MPASKPKPTPLARMSPRGRSELARLEGRVLRAYNDVAGLKTIGVGHLLTRDELDTGLIRINGEMVRWRAGISVAQSTALLDQDLVKHEAAVSNLIVRILEQHQFDALVSFCFNVGKSAFGNSTLRRIINAGDLAGVPAQFRRWIRAGGSTVPGLQTRREAEIAMWEGPGTVGADNAPRKGYWA